MSDESWTKKPKDFEWAIVEDAITQLDDAMTEQGDQRLNLKNFEVSSFRSLFNLVYFARELGKKVSVVVYDDGDPENRGGPLFSDIFRQCWEILGKPRDQFALDEAKKKIDCAFGWANIHGAFGPSDPDLGPSSIVFEHVTEVNPGSPVLTMFDFPRAEGQMISELIPHTSSTRSITLPVKKGTSEEKDGD